MASLENMIFVYRLSRVPMTLKTIFCNESLHIGTTFKTRKQFRRRIASTYWPPKSYIAVQIYCFRIKNCQNLDDFVSTVCSINSEVLPYVTY